MTDELEIYLTGCQVGITFTSILLGIVVEPAMTHVMEPLLTVLGVGESAAHGFGLITGLVLINLAHTIWAEQTPTYLGIEKTKLVAKYCAIPHFWWTRAVYPLLYVGDGVAKWTLRLFGIEMSRSWTDVTDRSEDATAEAPATRAELIEQMGSILKKGKLPPDRRKEVLQAIRIGGIPVRDAMVPRDDIVALSVAEPFSNSVRKIGESKHTRYLLSGDSLDDVRGVVYLPEVFAHFDRLVDGTLQLSDIAVDAFEVDAEVPLSELIDRLQEERHELAVVTDAGRVVGLITLTDAVEVIIGQSEDPLDILVAEGEGLTT